MFFVFAGIVESLILGIVELFVTILVCGVEFCKLAVVISVVVLEFRALFDVSGVE